jgi:hypothetical protein
MEGLSVESPLKMSSYKGGKERAPSTGLELELGFVWLPVGAVAGIMAWEEGGRELEESGVKGTEDSTCASSSAQKWLKERKFCLCELRLDSGSDIV